jgi:hypothetical protein
MKPPRVLAGTLNLRDVQDLERHAAAHFEGLPLPDSERKAAILGAVADAYRIDRALPPERPLLPVLDLVLASRAARLMSESARAVRRVA